MNKTRKNKAMGGGLKSVSENHIAIAMGNMMDDEGSMVLDQLDQLERACGMIRSYIGKDYEKQLPAWVQSKITLATDYIDKVSKYLVSNNEKKKGVISALEGIKSKIDGLISERKAKLSKYRKKILSGYGQSDVDEPIEETVKLTQEGTKHIRKDCKTLKRAEAYQDRLYDIYDKVKLLKSPKYSEDGEYVWEVGGKLLTREPNDPMTIRRQPNPNLLDYADE